MQILGGAVAWVIAPLYYMYMRILLVTPLVPPEPGGPSYYSIALREAFLEKGQEVRFRAFREVRKYPSGVRHAVFFFLLLRDALWAERVIALDTWSVALPAVCAARLCGKPVVLRSGGDFVWEEYIKRTGEKTLLSEFYEMPRALSAKEHAAKWLLRHVIFRLATRLVFSASWQRAISVKAYAIPEVKTAIIENQYGPKKEGLPPERKNFVCIYRPTPFKNIEALKAAFAIVKKTHPDTELDIHANIPREEAFEHMRSAYAVVIPSLSEVSSNLAIEALQFNKPCLVTKDCGIKDRLGDAVLYIGPNNPEDIASHMESILDTTHYAEALRHARSFSFVRTYGDIVNDFLVLLTHL